MRTLALCVLLTACGGEPITRQLEEPVRVTGGQFFEGDLPGSRALTGDEILSGVEPVSPYVTGFEFAGSRLSAGEVDRPVSGRTSVDGVAVGLRLADAGSGFWLLPVGGPDALNNDEPTWGATMSFSHELTPGVHQLQAAAFDNAGNAGTQGSLDICVDRPVPDNRNVCDQSIAPPSLVVSLEWDTEVDLDLKVITPHGKVVDPRHPSTALENEDGDVDPTLPGTGVIDFDSNAECVPDGKRRENLVFQTKPEPGTYLVYANLFDACGHSSVRFDVSLHSGVEGATPGTYDVVETFRQPGELLAVQANGGKGIGLFVTEFTVQ